MNHLTDIILHPSCPGLLQLLDGGAEGPQGGLLAPYVINLAHHHHLHPLRLPCQGRG